MRPDMGKCITERPRRGMRIKAPKGEAKHLQQADWDLLPKGESVRKKWTSGWNGKEFTDVLGPLEGFLKKNVGRPWDKIMSEVSKALPATGGVSYSHARDHLFQMVELKTQIIDGELCDSKGHEIRAWVDFYVDQHGILRRHKRKRLRYRPDKPKVFQKTKDGEWLIEDDKGIWWACTMDRYEATGTRQREPPSGLMGRYKSLWRNRTEPVYPMVYDAFLRRLIHSPRDIGSAYGHVRGQDPNVYCCRLRQIGKREIKKYGLRA